MTVGRLSRGGSGSNFFNLCLLSPVPVPVPLALTV